jgi:hypothetical protein
VVPASATGSHSGTVTSSRSVTVPRLPQCTGRPSSSIYIAFKFKLADRCATGSLPGPLAVTRSGSAPTPTRSWRLDGLGESESESPTVIVRLGGVPDRVTGTIIMIMTRTLGESERHCRPRAGGVTVTATASHGASGTLKYY